MVDEPVNGGPLADLDEDVDVGDVTQGNLEALIREHTKHGLGPLWLDEVQKAAPRVARRYSPSTYARSASWDEDAMGDLVQDVVERMITKSQVDYICDVANDFGHARALIYAR